MKIKIERKEKPQKPKKQKKTPMIKVGTHKKLTIILWFLLIGSVSFGVYKNFTAIDMHTIHEKEVIETKVVDTNRIESFVKSFAGDYYSWQQSQESIDNRNERLKEYFTEELQQLNAEMVRADIPTTSIARSVQIWSVEQAGDNDFEVTFSVGQQITENEQATNIVSTYSVVVHVDKAGNTVIIKNPTMDSQPKKSSYQPKQIESDGTVDAEQSEEITGFLETFFKLYPSATEKELAYYVSNDALPVVQKDYVFAELVNPVYMMKDNQVKVSVSVKYLDQETKTTHLSQYKLTLEKQENWKIIK
ncbi:conjugal transfer protein [Listeria monocytogenes]|uniref:conjugal transfer protein n=1 Tax=Bacilli TaxID=91061 RepID=UPI00083E0104|nr:MULTISPECIES: conjugal transfer protein [Bacilli]EAC7426779.1 conjugal transfer protein [Listeria monocytogenes]EAC7427208.1 conjugal transfer protein [Listeria monocytogenes]EAD1751324.1 conjugal transfer protein [Listeria monocytogenes]EAD1751430.1 conjugal transfer protein [Listeria monocytogenes]EAE0534744.1 conjugal transfer protein [Listeria monocytogenes]